MGSVGKAIEKGFRDVVDTTLDVVTLGQKDTIVDVAKGITGIGAMEAAEKSAKLAAMTAAEQKAAIAKQEKLISDQQRQQERVAAERRSRLSSNTLLAGSETGSAKTSLLARS